MKLANYTRIRLLVATIAAMGWSAVAFAQGGTVGGSMTEDPFTSYTGAVVAYVLLIGFLVAALLIGGLLVLNLGLMSKREEDRIGRRTPSDVGILRHGVWPEERVGHRSLPAQEDDAEETLSSERRETEGGVVAPRSDSGERAA
jgi:hypothetical protein